MLKLFLTSLLLFSLAELSGSQLEGKVNIKSKQHQHNLTKSPFQFENRLNNSIFKGRPVLLVAKQKSVNVISKPSVYKYTAFSMALDTTLLTKSNTPNPQLYLNPTGNKEGKGVNEIKDTKEINSTIGLAKTASTNIQLDITGLIKFSGK
jgi:hypothetical protein